MRPDSGGSSSSISSVPISWANSLADLVQPWVGALTDLSNSASKTLQKCETSLQTFQNTTNVLIGNTTITFNGLGYQAFANVVTTNVGHSILVNAKIHDFYNASNNLIGEINNLCSQYELGSGKYYNDGGGGFPNPIIYQFIGNMDYDAVLRTIMHGFFETASLDAILNASTIYSIVSDGVQQGCKEMQGIVTSGYDEIAKHWVGVPSNDPMYPMLTRIRNDYHTSLEIVQGLATNMSNQLEEWALALSTLAQTYLQEVQAAAQINKPTVGDFIWESSLPQFVHKNVLIWQLPGGGLLIMIKGGNKIDDEQIIRDYLGTYIKQNETPKVAIMGYNGNGINVAQQIIDDRSSLNINIITAMMIGNQKDLPTNQTLGINYIDYSLLEDPSHPWSLLGLNAEQITTMVVTGIVTIALDQPELTLADLTAAFGKLGAEKATEYAIALGFNASESGGETPEQYLVNWTLNHNQYEVVVNGKSIPLQAYIQQQINLGNTNPTLLGGQLKGHFEYNYPVPQESNLNNDLNNSAYLGSQYILDPNAISNNGGGIITVSPDPSLPLGS